MAQVALMIDGLGVDFGGFKAVNNVSLTIEEGELRAQLDHHRGKVTYHFESIFDTVQDDAHPLLLLWHAGDEEKQLATLRGLGFRDPQWTLARVAALRGSSRVQQMPQASHARMQRLVPLIIETAACLPNADATLDRMTIEQGQKHNLDGTKLQACIKAQNDDSVKTSVHEGEALGIEATPTMFVNGEKVDGALPIGELRAVLDRALVQAGETPPAHPAAAPEASPQPGNK